MLLTQLIAEHPEATLEIVRRTPSWVWGLLAALLALGWSATRPRDVAVGRLVAMPLAMVGLALWGVASAFGASGALPSLLTLWVACAGAVLALGLRMPPPAGSTFDAGTRRLHLPGSWLPLALIAAVFGLKYLIGVQLALEPALARNVGFAFAVTALYGLLSGLFAARGLRVLRLVRAPAAVPAA